MKPYQSPAGSISESLALIGDKFEGLIVNPLTDGAIVDVDM